MTGLKAVKYYDDPAELPAEWDTYFNDELRQRRFLAHLKRTSGVRHRYFFGEAESGRTVCGILSRQKIYMSRFGLSFFMPATVCALPMPEWSARAFGPEDGLGDVLRAMEAGHRGLMIVAGLDDRTGDYPGWTWKRHFPAVSLNIRWGRIEEYLKNLRASYRRRIFTALDAAKSCEVSIEGKDWFGQEAYALYEKHALKHRYRSHPDDILKYDFFRYMPLSHEYIVLSSEGGTLGWVLVLKDGGVLRFLLCGFSKDNNAKYRIYDNLLIALVKNGIEGSLAKVAMGQTAETSKMRIGGEAAEKYLIVRHSNPAVNVAISRTDFFSNRQSHTKPHVFK